MRTVLVPLDGSASAEHALPPALRLAARLAARVELVGVHRGVDLPAAAESALDDLGNLARGVDRAARRLLARYLGHTATLVGRDPRAAPVATAVLRGDPARAIARRAARVDPALVAMTTHGQGASRFWLGTVAERLLRRLACPVLVMRPPDPWLPRTPAEAAYGRGLRRVLVALEGTAADDEVLAAVRRLLGHATAEVTLLHVVTPLPPAIRALATASQRVREASGRRALAESHVARLLARHFPDDGRARAVVRYEDSAQAAIATCAEETRASLIALANPWRAPHVPRAVATLADRVLRTVPAPVLLCPRPAPPVATPDAARARA
jgi:nucleotide-binding universal stress UspA family protein